MIFFDLAIKASSSVRYPTLAPSGLDTFTVAASPGPSLHPCPSRSVEIVVDIAPDRDPST